MTESKTSLSLDSGELHERLRRLRDRFVEFRGRL